MAELHPNQIPFEAPEPVTVSLAAPKDYISARLANMASVIEDAVEFNMKMDDVELAARVKANMAEGIQNIETGDAIGGDYTALKNEALALYQRSFENTSPSAIKRYMRQNPSELKEYELRVEAVTADKENKAADVRIRKELNNISSRVALGQLSWTDAVNMLHVMGGDKITSEQYEAYTQDMRSDIDRYQLAMYLSGDMQSNMTALEKLQDPNVWETLSPIDRANAKARAQSNIDQMLKAMAAEKEKDDGEPYKTIRNSIVNSAYMWRDLGDGDQLTMLKDLAENVAVKGQMTYIDPATNKPVTVKYSDLTPEQWGKIRDDLDKVNLHSLKQQQHDTDFTVTANKLEANLEQGYANATMSNSDELATMMKDPRAADILKPEKAAQLTLKSDEFVDKLAAALRPSIDVDTPVSYSTGLWGLFRKAEESPWARANNLSAWADYQRFILNQRGVQDILNKIRFAQNSPNMNADAITEIGTRLLETDGKSMSTSNGAATGLNERGRVMYDAFKRAKEDYYLEPGDVAGLLTGDYSRSTVFAPLASAKQTLQDLISTANEQVFNGVYAAQMVPNSRLEYIVGLGGLLASKKDLAAYSEALGLPRGLSFTPQMVAEAVRKTGSFLERTGVRDQNSTPETRAEDAKLFSKALGLDDLNRTPEQKEEWNSLVYAAGWGQSNKTGVFSQWLDIPSSQVMAEPEKNTVNVADWTNRNKKGSNK